ncbi:MAG: hypothetical protein ACLS63_11120 [Flavonifractor plautii]
MSELKARAWGCRWFFLAGRTLAVAAMLLTRGLLGGRAVLVMIGWQPGPCSFLLVRGFLRVCRAASGSTTGTQHVCPAAVQRPHQHHHRWTVIRPCFCWPLASPPVGGLNNTVEQMTAEQAPQDVELLFYPEQEGEVDLPALLAEGGFDPEAECAFSLAVPVYRTGEERAITQSMHDAIAGRWGQDAAYAFRAHHGLDVQGRRPQGAHIDG